MLGDLPPPPRTEPPFQLTHRGHVYGLGFGPDFFGIWRLEGGPPVETFERTQAGWEAAWRRFRSLELRDHVPAWRRSRAGWILLHLTLGIALWFAVLVIEGMVLVAADRDVEEVTDAAGGGAAFALPLSIAAWMLFVYLGSRRARWWSFLALFGGALLVAIWTGLAAQPVG
ncbi:MAG: hypothetical protein ACXWYI_13200 [Actinomycetota bacterium]